ncbi:MAG: alpha/beta fold hydrolase [Candidatus Latescibacteria bacterium]|nr:alpha/beta fold hydrolase [Candidatus Latescibacterota bacterium]
MERRGPDRQSRGVHRAVAPRAGRVHPADDPLRYGVRHPARGARTGRRPGGDDGDDDPRAGALHGRRAGGGSRSRHRPGGSRDALGSDRRPRRARSLQVRDEPAGAGQPAVRPERHEVVGEVEVGTDRAGLILGLLFLISCSSETGEAQDHTVDLGSHSLHAVVAGAGSPTVVIDGGIGATRDQYQEMLHRIAETTTVVTYDRAGYGSSESGPLPRDSRREAEELRDLLRKLDVPTPYILVGHSLGGLNVQVYADLYPDDVGGLVLLDPPPLRFILGDAYPELADMARQMTDEWQGAADRSMDSEDPAARDNARFLQMLASEHREMFDGSARQAASIPSFGNTPLIVIASGVPNPMFGQVASAYQEFWAAESESLAAKSSRGRFIFAETSTHQLHVDAIDLVAERILDLVRIQRDGD